MFLVTNAGGADAAKTGFVDKTFKNADGTTSPYVVFVPKDYDGHEGVPGHPVPARRRRDQAAEPKKDGKMPVEVGIGPAIKKREKTFPFIVVIPRAEGFGWRADTANAKRALAMLDEVTKEYKVDPKRQYLTGLSMGGHGHLERRHGPPRPLRRDRPDLRPRRHRRRPTRSRTCRCWCFHGDADTGGEGRGIAQHDRGAQEGRRQAEVHRVPAASATTRWDTAYGTDELYTWLLEQKKK